MSRREHPAVDPPQNGAAEAHRLRHDIDNGRTGDKVDAPDPAAAPLGTDAEAGGAPPRAMEARIARATETSHTAADPKRPVPEAAPGGHDHKAGRTPLIWGAVALIAILVVLSWLL